MTNFYIAAAWVVTFGMVGGYAISVLIRGRRLTKLVPIERRRWMMDRNESDGTAHVRGVGLSGTGGGDDV